MSLLRQDTIASSIFLVVRSGRRCRWFYCIMSLAQALMRRDQLKKLQFNFVANPIASRRGAVRAATPRWSFGAPLPGLGVLAALPLPVGGKSGRGRAMCMREPPDALLGRPDSGACLFGTLALCWGPGRREVLHFRSRYVHEPQHAKSVGDHTKRITPRGFYEWLGYLAAG
jgi:hypothetical protein